MNRNKGTGISNNRSSDRQERRNDEFGLMRMSEFDEFDSMFEGFGMPRGFGDSDRFFGNMRSPFSEMERDFLR